MLSISASTITDRALHVVSSPFPVSFDNSSVLFGFALFSLVVISALASMLSIVQFNQLRADKHLGKDAAWAFNSLILSVCVAALMRCVPEVLYMISFAEASPGTLQLILTTKRIADFAAVIPVAIGMSLFWMYRSEIVLRLRSPLSRVYDDHRIVRLKRFGWIVLLAGGLAGAITLGRLFT